MQHKYNLKIKNKKIIIREDVTQTITTDQFHKVATEPITSTLKIGQGALENLTGSIKLLISICFLPLTKNLDTIIKNYENEIRESNKILLESIPQNVLNSANILTLASNPANLVFGKVLSNFEKIPGIKEILTAQFLTDNILTQQLNNKLSTAVKDGNSFTSSLLNLATKDLPDSMVPDYNFYRNEENENLQSLVSKLQSSYTQKKNISGKNSNINNAYVNILIGIINDIKEYIDTSGSIKKGIIASTNDNDISIVDCILNIFQEGKNIIPTQFNWDMTKAIIPNNTEICVRIKIIDSKSQVHASDNFITITKSQKTLSNISDWKNCFICLDDGTNQTTPTVSFDYIF